MQSKKLPLFTRAFFVALIAILAMGLANHAYSFLMQQPRINWGITGKWVIMLANGQLYTPSADLLPHYAHDWLLGFTAHVILSFLFALGYLIFLKKVLKKEADLLNGIGFGLALIVLPLFIQWPSIGAGIAGLDSPHPDLPLLRTFLCHVSFGFGLGLGGLLSKTK